MAVHFTILYCSCEHTHASVCEFLDGIAALYWSFARSKSKFPKTVTWGNRSPDRKQMRCGEPGNRRFDADVFL